MNTVIESVCLAYEDSRSDKLYVIELIEVEEQGRTVGYIVTGHNGRRNNKSLTPQPKITTPTNYATAKRVFDELEAKKCSPSYKTTYHVEWRNRPNTPSQTASQPRSTQSTQPQTRMRSTPTRNRKPAAEEKPQTEKKDPLSRLDMLEF